MGIEVFRIRLGNLYHTTFLLYILTSPYGISYNIYGSVRLQEFCKEKKLQLHVLKKNINVVITENYVIGNKIFARNTIGWKLIIAE